MAFSFSDFFSNIQTRSFSSNWEKEEDYAKTISTSLPVTSGITAGAGGGVGNAVALSEGINRVSTVATIADSVKLPASSPIGYPIVVINEAENDASIFPESGGSINNSVDGEFQLAGGSTAIAYKVGANLWTINGATEL